jgi:hypothetical protein
MTVESTSLGSGELWLFTCPTAALRWSGCRVAVTSVRRNDALQIFFGAIEHVRWTTALFQLLNL